MPIKYLYNVLHKRYRSNGSVATHYWNKLLEIENILKAKEFDSYSFLREFIGDIIYGVTSRLNN